MSKGNGTVMLPHFWYQDANFGTKSDMKTSPRTSQDPLRDFANPRSPRVPPETSAVECRAAICFFWAIGGYSILLGLVFRGFHKIRNLLKSGTQVLTQTHFF